MRRRSRPRRERSRRSNTAPICISARCAATSKQWAENSTSSLGLKDGAVRISTFQDINERGLQALFGTHELERTEQYDKRGQHASSGRAIDPRVNRRGWRSCSGETQLLHRQFGGVDSECGSKRPLQSSGGSTLRGNRVRKIRQVVHQIVQHFEVIAMIPDHATVLDFRSGKEEADRLLI